MRWSEISAALARARVREGSETIADSHRSAAEHLSASELEELLGDAGAVALDAPTKVPGSQSPSPQAHTPARNPFSLVPATVRETKPTPHTSDACPDGGEQRAQAGVDIEQSESQTQQSLVLLPALVPAPKLAPQAEDTNSDVEERSAIADDDFEPEAARTRRAPSLFPPAPILASPPVRQISEEMLEDDEEEKAVVDDFAPVPRRNDIASGFDDALTEWDSGQEACSPGWDDDDLILSDFDAIDQDEDGDLEPFEKVTGGQRARQLAFAFLTELGESTPLHLDMLADIIMARGWGTAQTHVRQLCRAGLSIPSVYKAFQLSEAWRDSEWLDARPAPGGRAFIRCNPRISWKEAAQIVCHVGTGEAFDVMLGFIDIEYMHWQASQRFRGIFPRFKDYLFDHRLALEGSAPATVIGHLDWTVTDAPPALDGVGEFWHLHEDRTDESYAVFMRLVHDIGDDDLYAHTERFGEWAEWSEEWRIWQ